MKRLVVFLCLSCSFVGCGAIEHEKRVVFLEDRVADLSEKQVQFIEKDAKQAAILRKTHKQMQNAIEHLQKFIREYFNRLERDN